MTWRARLNLPREHGAWAMFLVPLLAGTLVGGGWSAPVGWLYVASGALFISRESLLLVWRARARGRPDHTAVISLAIYALLAFFSGAVLLLHFHYHILLWLGLPGVLLLLINARLAVHRIDRTITSEIIAIGAMTLSGPAAHYVAGGLWNDNTWWLWVLSFHYFVSSVFYVRYRVTALHGRDALARQRVSHLSLHYHLLLAVLLVLVYLIGSLSSLILVAFLPIITRALYHHRNPPSTLNLRRIGMAEVVYALIFLILIVSAHNR